MENKKLILHKAMRQAGLRHINRVIDSMNPSNPISILQTKQTKDLWYKMFWYSQDIEDKFIGRIFENRTN